MTFEQNRNAEMLIISSAGIMAGTFTNTAAVDAAIKANAIPGITAFGYDHQLDVQVRGKGQFGRNKPVGITDEYGGIKGNFDVEGTDGEKAVLAAINRIALASYVNANYNNLYEFYVLANVTTDDGAALVAHFCEQCKVDGVPKKISAEAKRFSFQGIFGRDFGGKKIRFHVVDGAATPVTALSYPTSETPYGWTDENGDTRYALLILRYDSAGTNLKLELADTAAAGYYSETDSAVTLHADNGLAEGDKALVVYLT